MKLLLDALFSFGQTFLGAWVWGVGLAWLSFGVLCHSSSHRRFGAALEWDQAGHEREAGTRTPFLSSSSRSSLPRAGTLRVALVSQGTHTLLPPTVAPVQERPLVPCPVPGAHRAVPAIPLAPCPGPPLRPRFGNGPRLPMASANQKIAPALSANQRLSLGRLERSAGRGRVYTCPASTASQSQEEACSD